MSYRALPDPPPIPVKPADYRTDGEPGVYEAQYIASWNAQFGDGYHQPDYDAYAQDASQADFEARPDQYAPEQSAYDDYRPLPIPPAIDIDYQPLSHNGFDHVYDQPAPTSFGRDVNDMYDFNDMQQNLPPRPLPKPPQYVETGIDCEQYNARYDEPLADQYHSNGSYAPSYRLPQLDIPQYDEYKQTAWEPHHEPRQWSQEVNGLDIGQYGDAYNVEPDPWYAQHDAYINTPLPVEQSKYVFQADDYDVPYEQAYKPLPTPAPIANSVPGPVVREYSSTTIGLDHPTESIRRSRPPPPDVYNCENPWSRSEVFQWLLRADVHSDREVIRALRALVSHVLPNLQREKMKLLAKNIFRSYIKADEIQLINPQNGDIAFVKQAGQGIFTSLLDCDLREACYMPRCPHKAAPTLHRLRAPAGADPKDWMQAWGLSKESPLVAVLDQQAIHQQYALHELIYTETEYLASLRTFNALFVQSFVDTGAVDNRLIDTVFGNIQEITSLSEALEPLLADRQARQGPCIEHVADIFISWIAKARGAYVQYATGLRYGERAMRQRSLSDLRIKSWMAKCEADPRAEKLSFYSYQGLPTRRLQRYVLLLNEVLKKTDPACDEFDLISRAIADLRAACVECDRQVDLANQRISLLDLEDSLLWKVPKRDLQLTAPDRHIFMRGELQRKSDSQLEWQTRDVVLLDNFLLCLKSSRETGQLVISIQPIPVDYLVVEESAEVLLKSSSSRFAGTFTHSVAGTELRRRNTNSSGVEPSSPRKEELYPFTLKHAGRPDKAEGDEVLTLYAETAASRDAWIAAVRQVKAARYTKIAAAAPFEVKVHSISANHSSYIPQQPPQLDSCQPHDAVSEAVLRAKLPFSIMTQPNCATSLADGSLLIGADDGVYSRLESGRWKPLLNLRVVTQIAALTDFGILLVLADRSLLAFALADLRAKPQRLSGREVSFFQVGTTKGRSLVIYKQSKGGNSVFQALEPVLRTSAGKGDFFRPFDQFFVPTECHGLQFLKSTLCVTCTRGFEILSLDAKQPLSIPTADASPSEGTESVRLTELRRRLAMSRPLGAHRVREGEFLVCYDTIAVTLDKYGALVDGRKADAVPLVWQVRARKAALVRGEYAVACGDEAVEAWHVDKRSLRQVCTGRDLRMLEVSGEDDRLLFSMAHPYLPRLTVVFEMRRR